MAQGNKYKRSITLKLYLTILESIKRDGKLPINLLDKPQMEYYVSRLKKQGKIRRIGYGVWEIIEPQKTSITLTMGGSVPPPLIFFGSDDYRLHNVVFKVRVSSYDWLNVLRRCGVYYQEVNRGVFRVVFDGFKVWLCKGRVLVYVKPNLDFRASSLVESIRSAIRWFYTFYASFEAYLGLRATPSDDLVWGFSRKHISLVNNVIARDFNAQGVKFRVFDGRGLWLQADNSFNLGELEGVRNVDNVSYMSRIKAVLSDYKDFHNTPLPSEAYLLHLELTKIVGITAVNVDKIVRRLGWDGDFL